jgi:2,3-bisphosphoglycerate-independent phosphoglycerate mutase
MSFDDGVAAEIPFEITVEDQRLLFSEAKRLNTPNLTIVEGESLDHGLVWEALGDLGTTPAAEVGGKEIKGCLPEGDGEPVFRRFIDDSTNLLSSLPLNEERLDQGLPPINLLWPWGHGVRKPVPNLAIRRGEPALILSASLRLAGLARLAGFRHGGRASFGRGTNTRFEAIRGEMKGSGAAIIVIEASGEFVSNGKDEELNWLAKELDEKLIQPLLDDALTSKGRICLVCPSDKEGIGLTFETGMRVEGIVPFDERALEEARLAIYDLWAAVDRGLTA